MTWQKWVMVAWLALGALVVVAGVGKPRNPIRPSTAVIALLVNAVAAALVITG